MPRARELLLTWSFWTPNGLKTRTPQARKVDSLATWLGEVFRAGGLRNRSRGSKPRATNPRSKGSLTFAAQLSGKMTNHHTHSSKGIKMETTNEAITKIPPSVEQRAEHVHTKNTHSEQGLPFHLLWTTQTFANQITQTVHDTYSSRFYCALTERAASKHWISLLNLAAFAWSLNDPSKMGP